MQTTKSLISLQKGFLALMSVALLFSCSNLETFEMEDNQVLRASSINNEGGCITQDPDTWVRESFQGFYQNKDFVTVVVFNSPTTVFYEFSSSTTINSIKLGDETITGSTYSEPLPEGWDENTTIQRTFNFTRQGQGGGHGNATSVVTSYNLKPVCPPADCKITTETAYAGDLRGENDPGSGQGNNNSWWYAFDVEGDAVQNVYQNKNIVGQATLADGEITITLDGWDLQEGSESVKWISYADGSLPSGGRPTPGDSKKGNSLAIETNGDRYYVIHLDIEKEICD